MDNSETIPTGNWTSRIVGHAEVSPADLMPHPLNWREHPPNQKAAVSGSIAEVGWIRSVLVNKRTGHMLDGHLRLVLALERAEKLVPVEYVDVSEDEERIILATLDPLAALATANAERYHELTTALAVRNESLSALIESLKRPGMFDGLVDPDFVPAPPDAAETQRGQIYQLGDHRLMCGDSGSVEDLDRLLAGAPIHLVNTDPPYNVKVEPRSNNAIAAGLSSFPAGTSAVDSSDARGMHHQGFDLARHKSKSKATHQKLRAKDRPLANDFVTDDAFDAMLLAWFGNIARVLLPGRAFYLWGGYSNIGNYPPAMVASGLYFSQTIIWDKQHPVLTRKDYMGAHEWCFYGWREGAAHQYFGPNNATDLWAVKKINPQSMVHLTEKPVELARRALDYSSKPGENVLDLFGGSGSTLIACQEMGRHGYLMELDPLYCDVIVKRWEAFTGNKAEKVG